MYRPITEILETAVKATSLLSMGRPIRKATRVISQTCKRLHTHQETLVRALPSLTMAQPVLQLQIWQHPRGLGSLETRMSIAALNRVTALTLYGLVLVAWTGRQQPVNVSQYRL